MLCGSTVGKTISAIVRTRVASKLKDHTEHRQHGAIQEGGTEVPMLVRDLFFRRNQKAGRKAAIIFFDLKKAFYGVSVESVVGVSLTAR